MTPEQAQELERLERRLDQIDFELAWERNDYVKRHLNPRLAALGMGQLRPLPLPTRGELRAGRRKQDVGAGLLIPAPTLLVRTYEAEVQATDGRTVEARIAPYNVPATVSDPPNYVPYQEQFARGCFYVSGNSLNAPQVLLNFEHRKSISDVIGRAIALHDKPDGLHATFRMLDHSDGTKALELIEAGVLRGVSVSYRALKSRTVGGVVERIQCHLKSVALCKQGAHAGAEVLSVRTGATR